MKGSWYERTVYTPYLGWGSYPDLWDVPDRDPTNLPGINPCMLLFQDIFAASRSPFLNKQPRAYFHNLLVVLTKFESIFFLL